MVPLAYPKFYRCFSLQLFSLITNTPLILFGSIALAIDLTTQNLTATAAVIVPSRISNQHL
ncbi:hypothetical protein QT970_16385, partial [Microcoleus sp. herbarium8]|uniref:hypothetical protein n=1 Tax=Microcoleus sp. herbarium8 TaxID=3055436 RepID=UPI002FD1FCA5